MTTKYGVIEDVPLIRWNKLQPYWPSIVRSIAEVITENKFPPYIANKERPRGIVLSTHYWNGYGKKGFIYLNALKFLKLLKLKEEFRISIKAFNRNSNVDWLDEQSVATLGSRVYGFYYTLSPIFFEDVSRHRLSVKFKKST